MTELSHIQGRGTEIRSLTFRASDLAFGTYIARIHVKESGHQTIKTPEWRRIS
jgi:hypothetical protein